MSRNLPPKDRHQRSIYFPKCYSYIHLCRVPTDTAYRDVDLTWRPLDSTEAEKTKAVTRTARMMAHGKQRKELNRWWDATWETGGRNVCFRGKAICIAPREHHPWRSRPTRAALYICILKKNQGHELKKKQSGKWLLDVTAMHYWI